MDAPYLRDWFHIGAIVPVLAVLFSSAFGLFEAPAMSTQAELLWIMGIIVMALLVWFNAAKTQQRGREDRILLDDIKQLVAKPETTLEDVRRTIDGATRVSATTAMYASLTDTPLALQSEADKEQEK